MKIISCFIKTFKENLRDWKILILALVFAPFFIYMMYFYLGNPGSAVCKVAVVNYDGGNYSGELIKVWENINSAENNPVLDMKIVSDSLLAKSLIRNKDIDLFVTIPADFTESIDRYLNNASGSLPSIENYGDQANTRFMTAASFIDYLTIGYIGQKTGIELPVKITYKYAGRGMKLTEFDLYVPAMLVLSIIMMLFTAGASIVRETEKDTITRLRLSNLKSSGFMAALSLNQIIVGTICLLLTLFAAFSVGYKTEGSIVLLLIIGIFTCFSVISMSIITACFVKNMFGLLTLGCFPFFILMFFSDCFMPLPKIDLFKLFGNQIYLNDILPTATATRAFNKILNYDSGLSSVIFEIAWIAALSGLYFITAVWIFRKKYRY